MKFQKNKIKKEYKILFKKIDEILWSDWDPIGINDVAPRDEYQSYTPIICGLILEGASEEEVANKLYEIETDSIGVKGSINNCRDVAKKIINIKN